MSRVFLIPGLGADYHIYQHIELPGHDVVHVSWIMPEKQDTLSSYAQKLIDEYQIGPRSVVIGNSLGGMLAVEIAKKIPLNKTILISSIKTADEAPRSFKWYRYIPIYRMLPEKFFSAIGPIVKLAFGKMSKHHQELFVRMLKNTPPAFIKWAFGAILLWDNQTVPQNVYHITGDKDKIFPFRRIKGATIVRGGTHIMIFNKAKEINTWLHQTLQN